MNTSLGSVMWLSLCTLSGFRNPQRAGKGLLLGVSEGVARGVHRLRGDHPQCGQHLLAARGPHRNKRQFLSLASETLPILLGTSELQALLPFDSWTSTVALSSRAFRLGLSCTASQGSSLQTACHET